MYQIIDMLTTATGRAVCHCLVIADSINKCRFRW